MEWPSFLNCSSLLTGQRQPYCRGDIPQVPLDVNNGTFREVSKVGDKEGFMLGSLIFAKLYEYEREHLYRVHRL